MNENYYDKKENIVEGVYTLYEDGEFCGTVVGVFNLDTLLKSRHRKNPTASFKISVRFQIREV